MKSFKSQSKNSKFIRRSVLLVLAATPLAVAVFAFSTIAPKTNVANPTAVTFTSYSAATTTAKPAETIESIKTETTGVIQGLQSLSEELKNDLKSQLEKIKTDNPSIQVAQYKVKTNQLKSKARGLDRESKKVAPELKKYLDLLTTQKYVQASNAAAQDEEVFKALESVFSDPSRTGENANTLERVNSGRLNADYSVNTFKVKVGATTEKITAAIQKITEAAESLDGDKVVLENKKQEIKNSLNDAPLNQLAQVAKNWLETELEKIDNEEGLEPIKTNVEKTKTLVSQLNSKIVELTTQKTNPAENFNLADEDKKNKFTNVLDALLTSNTSNLFDSTTSEATTAKLAEANNLELNGTFNLTFAKGQINLLSSLSGLQRNQANLKLEKLLSKQELDDAIVRFTEINTNLSTAKTLINNNLINLSNALKDKFIETLDAIDVTDLTASQMKTQSDTEITNAQALNSKFVELKAAYDNYKSQMSQAKYVDATEGIKLSQDAEVASALTSVLDASTTPSVTNELQGKVKVNATVADIESAINTINTAIATLDGDTNLESEKNKTKAKTNEGAEFSVFNEATKTEFNKQINVANFISEVEAVDAKGVKALKRFSTIFQTITNLENIKPEINYKLANDPEIKAVDDALANLTTFKATNLLEDTSDAELEKHKTNADTALTNLNGNTNLINAETKVAGLEHIPANEREKAKLSLPKTTLTDLTQRVSDLVEVNTTISNNKSTIETLLKLSQEFRSILKVEAAAINVDQTKVNNLEHTNNVTQTAVALNKKYPTFQNASEDYISLHQTSIYKASTNKNQQNTAVTKALNTVLSDTRKDLDFNFNTNTFKYGTDMAKVEQTIAATKAAIKALDGEAQILKTKAAAAEIFTTDEKFKSLSEVSKATLQKLINAISSNQNDWEQKITEVKQEAENALLKLEKINANIALAEANADYEKVTELQQLKQVDLVDVSKFQDFYNPTPTNETNSNKIWWLLSLFALIPISIGLLFTKFKHKIK
ncbi:hypothetical protein ACW95P_04285 [Candidatus Mycoplasma pogonae]